MMDNLIVGSTPIETTTLGIELTPYSYNIVRLFETKGIYPYFLSSDENVISDLIKEGLNSDDLKIPKEFYEEYDKVRDKKHMYITFDTELLDKITDRSLNQEFNEFINYLIYLGKDTLYERLNNDTISLEDSMVALGIDDIDLSIRIPIDLYKRIVDAQKNNEESLDLTIISLLNEALDPRKKG